jgi:hypothetical protein
MQSVVRFWAAADGLWRRGFERNTEKQLKSQAWSNQMIDTMLTYSTLAGIRLPYNSRALTSLQAKLTRTEFAGQ